MFNSILVVCVGNICRSPTGEQLLKELLPDKKIESAGLSALSGKKADAMSCLVAKDNGLSLDKHIAKQLTSELCRHNDLILVMEKKHIDLVCCIAPEARGKVMLFGRWIDDFEVPDPYKQSREAFEFVYNKLNDAAQNWARILIR